MDCPKCGYALTAFDKDCARCRAVAADEFARSPASVWPPAIGPAVVAAPAYVPPPYYPPVREEDNSSGEERGGPPEIEELHWNWGAFFCGWLWCLCHRTYGLAALVIVAGLLGGLFNVFILPSGFALPSELMAVVLFGLCCYLGLHGHELAWQRRRFVGGVSQYFAVQRAWAVGGAVAFGVSALFFVMFGVLFLAAFRAYEARRQAANRPAPVAVSAPTGPAPLVLMPPQPIPVRRFTNDGGQDDGPLQNSPLRFGPGRRPVFRRDYDPRLQPYPGYVPPPPAPTPPAAAPYTGPSNPGPPMGGAPNTNGPQPGMSNVPAGMPPNNQPVPPASAPSPNVMPAPSPSGSPPSGSAGP